MRYCPRCKSVYRGTAEFCGLDGERIAEAGDDALIGWAVERYQIVGRLGEGGMAAVYSAVHSKLPGREFAVKVLHGEMASDKKLAERFRREAEAVSRIVHPNVVAVQDFGTTEAGTTFLVMELLRGRSLSSAIASEGPFLAPRAAHVTRQLAAGLAAVHERGYVHRDLKPSNVMLVPDAEGRETAKLLDFGLVRLAEPEVEQHRLTNTGHTMGTPYYMSPEQVRGMSATPRTDLYALGVVVYEMLTGKPPFDGTTTEVLLKHATEDPVPPPHAQGLGKLCLDLLAKLPEHRPKDAHDVIARIDALGLELPPPSAPAADAPKPTPLYWVAPTKLELPAARGPLLEGRAGWIAASAAAVLAALLFFRGNPPPSEPVVTHAEPLAAVDAGIVAPPPSPAIPAATTPPPPPSPARVLAELEGSIGRAAAKRGLTVDDLGVLDSTRIPMDEWRSARRLGELRRANDAARALLPAIARAKIDCPFIKQKLEAVSRMLVTAKRLLPAPKYTPLEARKKELDKLAQGAGCADLAPRIADLRSDVNEALQKVK